MKNKDIPIMKTDKGEEIVDTQVDKNNQLYYVFKNGKIEKYDKHKVELIFDLDRSETNTHIDTKS